MSFQEVVFNNNVLVRQISSYLLDGYNNLLDIALINRTFYAEICSSLSKIHSLVFYIIKDPEPLDLDNTQPSDDEEYQAMQKPKYGFELSKDPAIFQANLKFVTQKASIDTIDFSKITLSCESELTPLITLTGLKCLSFAPGERASTNPFYLRLIEKNTKTLKILHHPPENFLKSLVGDVFLNLDTLEVDIRVFRTMSLGIYEGHDIFVFEAYEAFLGILKNKLKVKSLILYGHDRARFLPLYQVLLNEAEITKLQFISDVDEEGDEVLFLQEWKNRNHYFPNITHMALKLKHHCFKNKYDQVVSYISDVFPNLKDLIVESHGVYDEHNCFDALEAVGAHWRKNFLQNCKHHVNLHLLIPQDKKANIEKCFLLNRSYQQLKKTTTFWYFSFRVNLEDKIFVSFTF